ncbi:MAG TPA: hypothetical protein ENK57_15825 [Polyangiaceae bacterium]|nr:hypothetical protein [Polyangiaceae bacterium]
MRFSQQLGVLAVAASALGLTACSSLSHPDTYEVDKDSVAAARPKPAPPAPAADGSRPGAKVIPGNPGGRPLEIPGGGAPRKQGG